jgi:uncharacterized delta-60 repeat protein
VAWGSAIQLDEKIIIVGQSEFRGFTVVRYNSNSSLDTTSDGDGIVITSLNGTRRNTETVAIQPDGEIVVIGIINGANNGRITVAQFNENGSLDVAFGNENAPH